MELARSLLQMKADGEVQRRYDDLARRSTESLLTEGEREELESLVLANTLVGLLKAEAAILLQRD